MNKQYRLSEYELRLKNRNLLVSAAFAEDLPVLKLSFDSRDVSDGTLFFCKGAGFKPEYAMAAKEKGAIAFVCDESNANVFCGGNAVTSDDGTALLQNENVFVVNDIRRAMAELSAMFNAYPWREFPLIGITGTKGKSTTLAYLKSIMNAARVCGEGKFGYISTIDTYDGREYFESHLTTPEAIELGMRLRNIADSELYAAAMEVSSQALKYHRTYGVEFDTAVFTNFGLDHIGSTEHPDIEDYLQSKLKILNQSKNAVVNLDTDRAEDVMAAAMEGTIRSGGDLITFARDAGGADYTISNVRKEKGKTVFELSGDKLGGSSVSGSAKSVGTMTLQLSMPGLFNVYNAAAAAIIALRLGATPEEIREGLLTAKAAGRCEAYEDKEREIVVISDYAHNALSFEALCRSVKEEYPGYRIEAVYGASGGKGYSRRSELPRIAAQYADFSWITEDDPGMEDPAEICQEVYANLGSFGGMGKIEVDRQKAITEAVTGAPPKTAILLLAKGNDSYMIRGREYVPIKSDSELAKELTQRH